MTNFNTPNLTDSNGEQKIRHYSHQPITLDHYGTKIQIHHDGRVTITTVSKDNDEMVTDEVKITAPFVFKIAQFLKGTRTVTFVTAQNQEQVKRYVHQNITITDYNNKFTIHQDGKVTINVVTHDKDKHEIEDEVTVPASVIFKTAQFLKGTRQIQYVSVPATENT